MKTKKLLYLAGLYAALPAISLFAYTATFDAADTEYLWSDTGIWDEVPSANGILAINSGGYSGSSILLKDTDLSALQFTTSIGEGATFTMDNAKYTLRQSSANMTISGIVNVLNGSVLGTNGVGHGNKEVLISGNGELNFDSSVFRQGSYGRVDASGSAVFNFANGSTAEGGYGQFMFSDSSKAIFDNATYGKNIWQNSTFSGNSQMIIRNAGTFNVQGSHSGNAFTFTDDSVLNIQSAGRFMITGGSNKLVISERAKIVLSDSGSSVSSNTGIVLNDFAKVEVRDGATVNNAFLNGLTINSDNASVDFYDTTVSWVNGVANSVKMDKGSINFNSGAVLDRVGDSTSLFLGGNTKLNFNAGSTYNANANASFEITENASVTFNAATYTTSSFGRLRISGGEMNFTNGSQTTGTFLNLFMSGSGKLNIDGAGTIFGQTQFNAEHWTIKDNAQINITNGGLLRANGSHGGVVNMVLSDSAQLNVVGGRLTLDKFSNTQRIQLGGNAKAVVKGTALQKGSIIVGYLDIENSASGSIASMTLGGHGELKVLSDINIGSGISPLALSDTASQQLVVSGAGNSLSFVNLNMQGDSLLKIEGSGSTITGSGALNATGGAIMFVADAAGVTTMSVNSISALNVDLVLDFSLYSEDHSFELISSSSDWSAAANAFIASSGWNRTDDKGNIYELMYDSQSNSIMGLYTAFVIPEPSVFAAVFGALALAFAAYRRRVQN